ncbi:uncharacterized protein TRAVEDRAFT_28476 [Trametes versicolor FP-101664 SS1]|uniref:uncharacterized protein n=1 Tax=Trametes versicolor (strain FP-101664) TaxID=717944 RepID=UPI00046248A5|nr:uncharacterized protein TRAVEDRAFT_28476 [Trametes versicolor FP-101664 SS1]EIW59158.1 hypothetical protein TRAVEDRAFT_28476 [Trametes versicolor FP-101664 SS1]
MASTTLFLFLLCAPALSFARDSREQARSPSPLWRRASSVPPAGFYDPTQTGGKMLTIAPNTGGLGEPLNVILSANSDSEVLVDSEDNGGLRNYFLSVGFGAECLGQHAGDAQTANLGDGKGQVNETSELRWDYGDPELGTCQETIKGGNHFRYWVQDGSQADSGAYFLATSYELPIQMGHDIIFDGYNLGRDWLVGNATAQSSLIPTGNVTNGTTYSGQTSFGGYTYKTDALYLSGIASNSTDGVNHEGSVGNANTLAVDGLVAVLTVSIVSKPASTSGALSLLPAPSWPLAAAMFAALAISLSA